MKTATLGQLLRYHRKQAELTQAQLAQKMGYTHSMISHFERDKRLPTRDFLEACVELLQLPPELSQEIWVSFLQVLAREPKPAVNSQDIADLIQASQPEQKNIDQLTWIDWQQIFDDIRCQQMAAGLHKYFPQLYLSRETIQQALLDFLQSEQRCLVIVGRSGVGKSNFLLAAAEQMSQNSPEIGVLLYNGATLPADTPLANLIAADVARQLKDESLTAEKVWSILKQALNSGRSLVVAVDALNEHPQPARLLHQLEQLAYHDDERLKLIWTCQPETWRQIRQQTGLTKELYFQDPASDQLFLTLTPFSHAELPAAYANYRQVFKLQTDFQRLTPQMQEMLRDPLHLLLVASIYHQQALPTALSTPTLVAEYLQALVRTERLQVSDIAWLTETLLPIMINEAMPVNGVLLSHLTPGVNHTQSSLMRLLNAELLIKEGRGPYEKITFKYERFFNYFGGQQLRRLAQAVSDPQAVYRRFVEHLPERLFLWGPLQTALLAELRTGNSAVVASLAGQTLPLKEELLADSLLLFSQEESQQTAEIVQQLTTHPQPVVRKTVLAVAERLQMEAVLVNAGRDEDTGVRWRAAYVTYQLWQKRPEAGWQILSTWVAVAGWQPRWPPLGQTLEVCLVTSALMMTDPQSNVTRRSDSYQRLQAIWQQFLGDLFLAENPTGYNLFRRVARRGIFWLMSIYFQRWVRRSAVYGLLDSFFALTHRKQAEYDDLINCFDLSYEMLLPQEDLLVDILEWNELAAVDIIAILLILKLPRTGNQGLPFVQRLFQRTIHPDRPITASGTLVTTIYLLMNRQLEQPTDEALALYRAMVKEHFDQTWGLYFTRDGQLECHFGLNLFSAVDWRCRHTTQPDLLIYALEKTFAEQPPHTPFILEGLLKDTLQLVSLMNHPHLALAALRVVFQHEQTWQKNDRVRAGVVNCLAVLKRYAPQEVEHLLNECDAPASLRHLIQGRQATDDMWRQILFPRLSLFLGDVLPQPATTHILVELLRAIPNCSTPARWLNLLLHHLINQIYGKPLV